MQVYVQPEVFLPAAPQPRKCRLCAQVSRIGGKCGRRAGRDKMDTKTWRVRLAIMPLDASGLPTASDSLPATQWPTG